MNENNLSNTIKKSNSLYSKFGKLIEKPENWLYFKNSYDNNDYYSLEMLFSNNGSSRFIHEYFNSGGKEDVFKIDDERNLKIPENRAYHTLSAYMFGILLRDNLHFNMSALPEVDKNVRRRFLYFWSLICLFHDFAYSIETESENNVPADYTIADFNNQYNIKYKFIEAVKEKETRDLIINYFDYRINMGCIDHGISGAMIIYDRLMKVYENSYGLSKRFPKYCRIVARVIALHNMWRATEVTVNDYKKYKLFSLIKDSEDSHILKYKDEHNLLFLLGLVDTIDPIKFFKEKDPIEVLKRIKYHSDYMNRCFVMENNFSNQFDYREQIHSLEDWLDVDVKSKYQEIIVSIEGLKKTKSEE